MQTAHHFLDLMKSKYCLVSLLSHLVTCSSVAVTNQGNQQIERKTWKGTGDIHFVKVPEVYTSKVCNTCHNLSLEKVFNKVTYRDENNQEFSFVVQTRYFKCKHHTHPIPDGLTGDAAKYARYVNRDLNASRNIAWNLIEIANGRDTTWDIGFRQR